MTLAKGFCKITIAKRTEARLKSVRRDLAKKDPEKFDEETSLHQIITELIDHYNRTNPQKWG